MAVGGEEKDTKALHDDVFASSSSSSGLGHAIILDVMQTYKITRWDAFGLSISHPLIRKASQSQSTTVHWLAGGRCIRSARPSHL